MKSNFNAECNSRITLIYSRTNGNDAINTGKTLFRPLLGNADSRPSNRANKGVTGDRFTQASFSGVGSRMGSFLSAVFTCCALSLAESDRTGENWRDFFAGVLGGMAGIIFGQPLDVARVWHESVRCASHAAQVRLQTQTVGNSVRYSGLFSCMHHLWRTEGPLVFYRGILPPLAAVAGVNSLLFGSYGALRRILQKDPNTPLTLSEIGVCGNIEIRMKLSWFFTRIRRRLCMLLC